jgi:probable HAF family extracellular repeat protein
MLGQHPARRSLACFSRRGLDLLRHPGMAWLKSITWPFESAMFDGEACAGDGHEGIQAVVTERNRIGGDMALVLFDSTIKSLSNSLMAGGMRDLGTLGGIGSRATAINASGQVIGESDTADGASHAFSWTAALEE